MEKNNSGLSIIELVVAVAIFAIASLSIYEFVIIASKHYQNQTVEVNLQYESQLAMNQLQDLLVDATRGVSYSVNDGAEKILWDDDITQATVTTKELSIYNDEKYHIIIWDASLQQLLYTEYQKNDDNSWTQTASKVLMAEYVKDFQVDLYDLENSSIVRLAVNFENGKEYSVAQNVTLRNKVAVNKDKTDLY